jgi:hypothetical protein
VASWVSLVIPFAVVVLIIVVRIARDPDPHFPTSAVAPLLLGCGVACSVGALLAAAGLLGIKSNGAILTLLGAVPGLILNVCVGAGCVLMWCMTALPTAA